MAGLGLSTNGLCYSLEDIVRRGGRSIRFLMGITFISHSGCPDLCLLVLRLGKDASRGSASNSSEVNVPFFLVDQAFYEEDSKKSIRIDSLRFLPL